MAVLICLIMRCTTVHRIFLIEAANFSSIIIQYESKDSMIER